MRLKVSYDRSGDVVIVVLSGEVDLSVEKQFRAMLDEALRGQPPPVVVVDLAGVRFLDCAGVRVLLRARRAAHARGCALTVRDPQPIVEQVLRVLQVADVLGLPRPSAPGQP